MQNNQTHAQRLIARASEDVLNSEAYHLYANLIAGITAFQLGNGLPPTDEEFAMWRAAQQKRLDTTLDTIDTFLPRV
jgi:hypothetical protein